MSQSTASLTRGQKMIILMLCSFLIKTSCQLESLENLDGIDNFVTKSTTDFMAQNLEDFGENRKEFDGEKTTKSLEQNIDDYYSSVDIEFDQIFAADVGKDFNLIENSSNINDDVNFKIKRSVEDENESDEGTLEESSEDKHYYRDTYFDRIAEDTNEKRKKRDVTLDFKPTTQKTTKDITGDTVLHIRSGMSDVIKSETDLKDTLTQKPFLHEGKAKSYIDDVLIHPSEFIPDETPFGDDKIQRKTNDKKQVNDGPESYDGDDLSSRNSTDDYDLDNYQADGNDWRQFTNDLSASNDTEELLAALDMKKVVVCRLPEEITSVSWFRDNEAISLVDKKLYQTLDSRHLVIGRVGREHSGTWQCRGTLADGRHATSTINVVVMEPPSAPYLEVSGRRLDPGNVFLPAREGSELVLSCRADRGRPHARLHWEPTQLAHVSHSTTATDDGATTISIASFTVRRAHHNITISCIATHPALASPLTASTLLHVQYAPRFGISRVPGFGFPLREGSAVSLRCEVDSNPPAHPRWRKDEMDPPVAQSTDGYLNFSNVRREHSGWYKCSATHALGNYSSIGYFLNVRYEVEPTKETSYHHTVSGQKVEIALGGAVKLQCPQGSWDCWAPQTSSAAPPAGLLYLSRGEYRCQGRPQDGGLLYGAPPHPQGGPSVSPRNASIAILETESLVLESEYCSQPSASRVVWLVAGRTVPLSGHYGRIITDNYANSSTGQCSTARLSIASATAADSGEYSLLVRGAGGVAEAVFAVAVGPGPSPERSPGASPAPRARDAHAPLLILVFVYRFTQILNSFVSVEKYFM